MRKPDTDADLGGIGRRRAQRPEHNEYVADFFHVETSSSEPGESFCTATNVPSTPWPVFRLIGSITL
jgi:hypothetical protein